MSEVHDLNYYLKCMMGGALACGLSTTAFFSHWRIKFNNRFSYNSSPRIIDGFKKIKGEISPTFIGYSLQGLGRFGFYEIFKDVYKKVVGEEKADEYRKIGWSVASGSA